MIDILNEDHFLNSFVEYSEFLEALESFSTNTSPVGLYGISYQLLVHLPCAWKRLLHSLIQSCWISGAIPKLWEKSVIIPVLKQGKPRSDVNNYRPIALTSHVCKLMEKIIQQRLVYYCEKSDIIPINQAGFRKGRSTTDQLIKLSSQIKNSFLGGRLY